jgi:hypothetical protein
MAQVPQDQRARVVHQAGDSRHVGQRSASVSDVRQADQGHVGSERREQRVFGKPMVQIGMNHPQLATALGGDALQHVTVGREVVVIGDQHASTGLRVQGSVD